MEWLLQELEEFKVQYNSHRCHPDKHLKTNINLTWKKLDEYYTLLDDPPASSLPFASILGTKLAGSRNTGQTGQSG